MSAPTKMRARAVSQGKKPNFNPKTTKRFDKNDKYKQFCGNVTEGQGFADKRKQKAVKDYEKLKKKERRGQRAQNVENNVKKIYNEDEAETARGDDSTKQNSRHFKEKKKIGSFKKAEKEFKHKKEEKEKKLVNISKRKIEIDEHLKVYSKKKRKEYRLLSRKTSRGQPIINNQMKLLLSKIEKQCADG